MVLCYEKGIKVQHSWINATVSITNASDKNTQAFIQIKGR